MNSVLVATEPLGAQRPRHLWIPDYVRSYGAEAVELAEMAGLDADEWQRFVVDVLLGVRADGKWAAFEAGLEVARQNGKGGVYEIRELAGLFLLGERLLIHSAHEYKTAEQALDRMEALIDGCADLSREVKAVKRSHGQEGIYLKSGQALRYFTRTASGGRGFSCDFLGLDEAMKIKASMHSAMFPTMSARPNPQILYAGSAVDQETMEDALVFARVRRRGIKGGDPRLAYFGWSAPFDHPDEVNEAAALDVDNWKAANPAFEVRISAEYIENEQRALGARGFAVERLGVGDWPAVDEHAESKIDQRKWRLCADERSVVQDPVCLAFDVTPNRSAAAIGAVGLRGDGKLHGEVIQHRKGTGWVIDRLVELEEKHTPVAVVCGGGSPAESLIAGLNRVLKREVKVMTSREHASACGSLFDLVEGGEFRHLDTPDLNAAVKGAATRPLGDAWAWSRTKSSVDISPLCAVTLAVGGFQARQVESREAVFL